MAHRIQQRIAPLDSRCSYLSVVSTGYVGPREGLQIIIFLKEIFKKKNKKNTQKAASHAWKKDESMIKLAVKWLITLLIFCNFKHPSNPNPNKIERIATPGTLNLLKL